MQPKLKNDKALETYKIFPYVAWGLTIIFTFFVYNIAMELQAVTKDLQAQTEYLEERIAAPVEEIEDFERSESLVTE